MSEAEPGLARALSLFDGTMIVSGTIVGIGIFFTPSRVAAETGSAGLALLCWALGGVIAMCGACTYAGLGMALPRTGGPYLYLREGLGQLPAFLYVYMALCAIISGANAVIGLIFADHLARFVALPAAARGPAAAAAILVLMAVNILGVRWGGRVQNLLTVLKIVSLAGLIAAGLLMGRQEVTLGLPEGRGAGRILGGMVPALVGVLFSLGGWQNLSNVASEMRRPDRDLPRAILMGVAGVVGIYLFVNLAYLRLLPLDRIARSNRLAADAVEVVLGGRAGDVASALILCSAFGILNGLILSAPRLYYAAARDGLLPRALGRVHPRYRTPLVAILLQGVISSGLCFVDDVWRLLDYVVFADWLFFSLNALALFVLARGAADLRARLRAVGYPIVPLFFLVASALMTVGVLVEQWPSARVGLGILLLGLGVHLAARRARRVH